MDKTSSIGVIPLRGSKTSSLKTVSEKDLRLTIEGLWVVTGFDGCQGLYFSK
jgi:hypothetical protein